MTKHKDKKSEGFLSEWFALFCIVERYWSSLGGWRDIVKSPYIHIAIILTICSINYWSATAWYSQVISVLPNLLGFGVTGYAIWIGWGDDRLKKLLKSSQNKISSDYLHVSAIFAHFCIVQVISLTYAILASIFSYEVNSEQLIGKILLWLNLSLSFFSSFNFFGGFIGFFLFIYAILTALETILALFRISSWVDRLSED